MIQDRIDDARALWAIGHKEGAFLFAIIAVVAKAREEFPRPMREPAAFRNYVKSRFPTRISVEYQGNLWPIEDILYKWFRCEIVHGGGLPSDVQFLTTVDERDLVIRSGGQPDHVLLVSPGWFHQLLAWAEEASVGQARETQWT